MKPTETRSNTGEFLGYQSFPVLGYKGAKCNSEVALKNDVKVNIDWRVVEQSKLSDGTLNVSKNTAELWGWQAAG